MKKLQANLSYSLIHAAMWGMYAIIFAFAKPLLEKQGLTDIQCSIVLGTTAAASVLLNVVISELVSRIKKLKLFAMTLLVGGLILIGLGAMLTSGAPVVLAGISVVLSLLQLIPGMCNSIGMDAIAKGAPATYSIARGTGSLFYAISAFVAGMLDQTGLVILSIGLGVALIIGVVWFHFCAERGLAEVEETAKAVEKKDNFLMKNPRFSLFLVGATFLCISHFFVCTFMWDVVVNLRLGDEAVNNSVLGTATAISAFVELPIMFGFSFLAKKIKVQTMLKFAAIMFLAKTLGLFFATGSVGIYAAQATQVIGYGLYAITSVTYAGKVMGKEDAVRAQSYLAATISLGNVVAMSTGGVIIGLMGVKVMLLAATGCALAGALFVLFTVKETQE